MRGFWRPLACVAALSLTLAAGVSTAQTVSIIKAPSGAPIELVLNAATIASTTTTAAGDAALDVNLAAHRGKSEIDANLYLDTCGAMRRILLVEPGVEGMPVPPECTRLELGGIYVVRDVTSFVINLAGALPTVRFRQGPAPAGWLDPQAEQGGSGREWGPMPTGLVAFGGGGLAMSDTYAIANCGNVPDCSGSRNRFALSGGIDVWLTPFFGAEGSYLRPADVTVDGRGEGHRFTSALDLHIVTVGGKIGVPAGPVRFYGKGGATYARADSVTTQSVNPSTVTIDGEEQTRPGGTQSFGLRVTGWGWFFGGGAEIWMTPRMAVYGEYLRTPVTGDSSVGGEGSINETVTSVLGGIRFRIGG